jgi:hypothetical protein
MRGLQPGHLIGRRKEAALSWQGFDSARKRGRSPVLQFQMSQLRGNISANQVLGMPHVARLSVCGHQEASPPTRAKTSKPRASACMGGGV